MRAPILEPVTGSFPKKSEIQIRLLCSASPSSGRDQFYDPQRYPSRDRTREHWDRPPFLGVLVFYALHKAIASDFSPKTPVNNDSVSGRHVSG